MTDSGTLKCLFEMLLLKTYKELSRTFGQLERTNQVSKCIKTYLISIFFHTGYAAIANKDHFSVENVSNILSIAIASYRL